MISRILRLSILGATIAAVAPSAHAAAQTPPQSGTAPAGSLCETGAYRSERGDVVVLVERTNPHRFSYYFRDGRWGRVHDEGSPIACLRGTLSIRNAQGAQEVWSKVQLRLTPTRFRSGDVELSGLLVEPPEGERAPLVVSGHGSERIGAIGSNIYPHMLAAQGVAVFQYDKRGTGTSGGRFSSNFQVLARDMVAASAEARRLSGGYSRFGLIGGSQAGWVIPLAARDAGAEFMAILFGGIFSPAEEDLEGMLALFRERGYGEDVLSNVRQLNAITTRIYSTRGRDGFDELAAFRRAYASERWFQELRPDDYTREALETPEPDLRRSLSIVDPQTAVELNYDPLPALRSLQLPTLWVLAGEDRESPGRLTEQRLDLLRQEGHPIEVVTFPNTDHGIVEFVQRPDGSRQPTRTAEGFYRLLADWIHGRISPPYGRAVFQPSPARR